MLHTSKRQSFLSDGETQTWFFLSSTPLGRFFSSEEAVYSQLVDGYSGLIPL